MILEQANQIPPFLCRVIARRKNGWTLKSIREIAELSGIPKSKVALIAVMKTWDDVTLSQADAFARACGVDLMNPKPHKNWLVKSNLRAVIRARKPQRELIMRTFRG